jgi:hypothetical protein
MQNNVTRLLNSEERQRQVLEDKKRGAEAGPQLALSSSTPVEVPDVS